MKTFALCFDVDRDFGLEERRTNVLKLYSALARDENQIPEYVPIPGSPKASGRGEALLKTLESLLKLEAIGAAFSLLSLFVDSPEFDAVKRYGFGNGIALQLQSACEFLIEHWAPGDGIVIFGNGHSAGIALLFVRFVHQFGLIPREMKDSLPSLIDRFFRGTIKETELPCAMFQQSFSRSCAVSFLGIWDCIDEMTFIKRPVRLRPQMAVDPCLQVRHAVSIDEHRGWFRPLVLSDADRQLKSACVKEVWFAGVHADVMGGYLEAESGLSQIALAWMIDEAAKCGIRFDGPRLCRILGAEQTSEDLANWPGFESPNPLGPAHESLRGFAWEMEFIPRKRGDGTGKYELPLGRRRRIPAQSLVHPSVVDRMNSSLGYRPKNLPTDFQIVE